MEPKLQLVRGGVVVRRQPPIVGDYCKTPHTSQEAKPCGYTASTCRGDSTPCPRCRFRYCEKHYPTHVRPIEAPPDVWLSFMRRLNTAIDNAAKAPDPARRKIRLPAPEV